MRCNRKFTLMELLIVIAILAILIALLLPALRRAKFAVYVTACSSNLRQIAGGLTNYAGDNDRCYPVNVVPRNGPVSFKHVHDRTDKLVEPYGISTGTSKKNGILICPGLNMDQRKYNENFVSIPNVGANPGRSYAIYAGSVWESVQSSGMTVSGESGVCAFGGPCINPHNLPSLGKAMMRLGDRWVYSGQVSPSGAVTNPSTFRFNVLADDCVGYESFRSASLGSGLIASNHQWPGNQQTWTAAPAGSIWHYANANSDNDWGATFTQPITANYALDDGSVKTFVVPPTIGIKTIVDYGKKYGFDYTHKALIPWDLRK